MVIILKIISYACKRKLHFSIKSIKLIKINIRTIRYVQKSFHYLLAYGIIKRLVLRSVMIWISTLFVGETD